MNSKTFINEIEKARKDLLKACNSLNSLKKYEIEFPSIIKIMNKICIAFSKLQDKYIKEK